MTPIGYRILPQNIRELTTENIVELVGWLRRVCSVRAEGLLAIDMIMQPGTQEITMHCHIRNAADSKKLGCTVIDVRTFRLFPHHNVPTFLVKQFYLATPVPADGFGDVEIGPTSLLIP